MSEKDYIKAQNLTRIRIAWQVMDGMKESALKKADRVLYQAAIQAIDILQEHLFYEFDQTEEE